MILKISFAEMSEYVSNHYSKSITFSYVSDNTICIAYEQSMFITTVKVPVNVCFEDIKEDEILLKYYGKIGIDSVISAVLKFLKHKNQIFSEAIIAEEGHHLRVRLSDIEQAQSFVKAVALKDICMTDEGIEISAHLK